MIKEVKKIAVTGGCGQIAYNLLFRIASGEMFGKDQPIVLHLLDLPMFKEVMEGIVLELQDCCYPLLKEIKYGFDPYEVFKGVDIALLIGAKPRGPGMERKDLIFENAKIFKEQGKALNAVAHDNVKVLVVGNPCNTNALICMNNAPDIPRQNFLAMTRLDENRAKYQLAKKANVKVEDIKKMAVWGNHSATQVPDFSNAIINDQNIIEIIQDSSWLQDSFMELIQKRGAEIIKKRGKSSAASAANAIIDTIKSLYTPSEDWFSLAVCSDNNPYGIKENLIFSFPCLSDGKGNYKIVKGLDLDSFIKSKIKHTENELMQEKEMVAHLMK